MLSYTAKNSTTVLLGNTFISIIAFITTVILTNTLSKELFGTYRFVLSIIPLLLIATLPDMGTAVTRAVAREQIPDINSIIKEKIKYGIVASIVSIIFCIYYLVIGNKVLSSLFIITAFFIPFFDVFLIYINVLYGKKLFKTASIYNVISKLFSATIIILAVFLTQNIYIILTIFFVSQIIPQLFFYRKINKTCDQKNIINDPSIIVYGKHLTILGTISVITNNIDKILVWYLLGAESLAVYVVALLIVAEGSRLVDAISIVLLPVFSESKSLENIKKVVKNIPLLILFLIFLTSITILIIPAAFPIIFPNYIGSIRLAQISTILFLFIPINSIIYRYFIAEGTKRIMFKYQIIKILALASVFFSTYNKLNIYGALISLITSEILGFLYIIYTLKNYVKKQNGTSFKIITEKKYSIKILLHKINHLSPTIKQIINIIRFFTFAKKCKTYPQTTTLYSDGSWVERKTTKDQEKIEYYLEQNIKPNNTILHIGVGNSSLAKKINKKIKKIDGITIIEEEKNNGDALKIHNYQISIINKNNTNQLAEIKNTYDYIVDNDIAAYSCCKKHFEEMMKFYTTILSQEGKILVGKISSGYFDYGFPLINFYIKKITKNFNLEIEENKDIIIFKKNINPKK